MNPVPGEEIQKFTGTNVPMQFIEPATNALDMRTPSTPSPLPSPRPPVQVSTCTRCKKILELISFLGRCGKRCPDASQKRNRLKAALAKRRDSQVSNTETAPSIAISNTGTDALPNLLLGPRFKPRVKSLTTISGTELSSEYWGEAEKCHLDDLGEDFVYKLEGKILRAMSMQGKPNSTGPFLAQPHKSISLADVFRSVDMKVDLLRHNNSPPTINTPTARLEHAITRLALVTRLQEVTWRYKPLRRTNRDIRKDFFREVSLLHKQFQAGYIHPWAPVATWLQWYTAQCQDAGLHPLRQAAKKERMIDEHRSWCAEQYILCRSSRTRLCLTCARTSYPHEASPHVRAYALHTRSILWDR
jgi:hypothetical protein